MRLSAPPDALHPVRPPTSAAAFDATRPEVRRLLTAIPSFLDLPDDERRRIAADTVRVLAYLADPNGVHAEIAEREANGELPPTGLARPIAPPHPVPAATALADDPVTATKRQLAQDPGFAGKDFQAGAVKQGVEQFGQMVQKVDFPKFVGGLIKNVFQAIVESSIEQMRAYGELIANVAKTTGQFMSDNISEGPAATISPIRSRTCCRCRRRTAPARSTRTAPARRRPPPRRGWWRRATTRSSGWRRSAGPTTSTRP